MLAPSLLVLMLAGRVLVPLDAPDDDGDLIFAEYPVRFALSSDGSLLAWVMFTGQLGVTDTKTKRIVWSRALDRKDFYRYFPNPIFLSFSDDDREVAIAARDSAGFFRIFSSARGEERARFDFPNEEALALSFSDGEARTLWVERGPHIPFSQYTHHRFPNGSTFTFRTFASSMRAEPIAAPPVTFYATNDPATLLARFGDESCVSKPRHGCIAASTRCELSNVRYEQWTLSATGVARRSWTADEPPPSDRVSCGRWSTPQDEECAADDDAIVLVGADRLRILDRQSGAVRAAWWVPSMRYQRSALSPHGHIVALSTGFKHIRIVDLSNPSPPERDHRRISRLAISREGRVAVARSSGTSSEVYLDERPLARDLPWSVGDREALRFSPDGHRLYGVFGDGTHRWFVGDDQHDVIPVYPALIAGDLALERCDSFEPCALFDLRANKRIARRKLFTQPSIFELTRSALVSSGAFLVEPSRVNGSVVLAPDERFFAASDNDTLELWEVKPRRRVRSFEITPDPKDWSTPVFSPSGQLIAAVSGRHVYLWSVETGELDDAVELPDHQEGSALAFTPDEAQLLIGTEQGRVLRYAISAMR